MLQWEPTAKLAFQCPTNGPIAGYASIAYRGQESTLLKFRILERRETANLILITQPLTFTNSLIPIPPLITRLSYLWTAPIIRSRTTSAPVLQYLGSQDLVWVIAVKLLHDLSAPFLTGRHMQELVMGPVCLPLMALQNAL